MAFRVPVAPRLAGEPDDPASALQAILSRLPSMANAPRKVPGRRVPGNIDFSSRPKVQNRDGSVSTVRSASFGTPEGEVLIPTIGPQGQDWTPEEAWKYAQGSGQNLGVFDSPEAANAYAEWLHNQQQALAGHDPMMRQGAMNDPRPPVLAGGPQAQPQPDMTGVTVSPGAPALTAPDIPQRALATAPRIGDRRPVSVGRTIADVLFKGESPYDSIDTQKTRFAQSDMLAKQRADMLAFADTLDPRERAIFLADPQAWAKARSTGLEAYTLNEGSVRGQDGKPIQYDPRTVTLGDQALQTQQGGGVNPVYTRPPTYAEKTDAARLNLDAAKPIIGNEGAYVPDGQGGYRFQSAPQIKTVSGGESLVQIGGDAQPVDWETAWSRMVGPDGKGGLEGGTGPDGTFLTSPKGAIGPAQVMPDTAPEAARLAGLPWDANRYRTDPDYNLALGKAYYKSLVQKYGDPVKAAAAYQSGPGTVDAAIAKFGDNWIQGLGPQGQAYVRGVTGGQSQAGVSTLVAGQPKPMWRTATTEEKIANGLPPEQPAQVSPDGKIEAIGDRLKPVPPVAQKAIIDNELSLRQLDRALAAVQANPKAFGWGNMVGPDVLQYTDPGGVDARAVVADIGSLILHDRSGAAVTLSEAPRFAPFVPKITDTPEAITKKLQQLRNKLADEQAWLTDAYGPNSGYRPSPTPQPPPRQQPAAASKPPAVAAPRKDPFPGIKEGQIVVQDGVKYQRKGNQMVEVR